jgi:hypothetical protein
MLKKANWPPLSEKPNNKAQVSMRESYGLRIFRILELALCQSRGNLDADRAARVDFSLRIGALNEEITVTHAPPWIQTDTSTLGRVIDPRQMRELPLNERNFLSFALLVPGKALSVNRFGNKPPRQFQLGFRCAF